MDERGFIQFVHPARADAFAVAQDGHLAAQGKNLLQAMRDVNNPGAIRTEVSHNAKDKVLLLLRERSRRLIHDDDAGARAQRAGDFNQLLFRHGQAPDFGLRVNLHPEGPQQLSRPGPSFAPMNSPPGCGRLQPQRDIFGHGKVRKERGLLVDAGNSQFARQGGSKVPHPLTIHVDLAGIRSMRAGHNFDQRGLARSVFTEQGMHLAGTQLKGNPSQCAHGAKVFSDPGQLEERAHADITAAGSAFAFSIIPVQQIKNGAAR